MESDFDPGTSTDDVVGDEPSAPEASPSLAWVWYVVVVLFIAGFAWGVRGWMNHSPPPAGGAAAPVTKGP